MKNQLIIPWVVWALVIIASILTPMLVGCTSQPTAQVCYMRGLGQTEDGYMVVMQACQSPDEFKKIRK